MLSINRPTNPTSSDTALELRRSWQEWAKSLSRFVRSERRSGITAQAYEQQHRAVLRAIARRRAEAGDDPLLRRAEALAAPWVSLDACRVAADAIKRDLLAQMEECELVLSGRTRRRQPLPWRNMAIAVALVLVVAGLIVDQSVSPSHSLLSEVRYGLFKVGFWIRHSSMLERVAAGVFVMLAVGWWTTQSLRSI